MYPGSSRAIFDKASAVTYFVGYTSMRERPEPPCKLKAKPVEQVQSDNQLLDEEISRVRAERWDILAKQLVELYTQKHSLTTLRLEMLAPQR